MSTPDTTVGAKPLLTTTRAVQDPATRGNFGLAPEAGSLFQKVGGAGDAFGGFGHLGGDLARSIKTLRSEDGTQVRDQRVQGALRKGAGGTDFQPLDRGRPHRLIEPEPKDQCRDSGTHGRGRGACAPMMDDGATGGKDRRVVH